MEIKTLEGIPLPSIAKVFNEAFSDYSITVQYSDTNFGYKILSEGIDLKSSPAAFIDGQLAGFILHGLDTINGQLRVFNAGTGVVPMHRGKRIVEQLYNFIFPVLAAQGYRHHQLEVLAGNSKAEKIYLKAGFTRSRKVVAYKGAVEKREYKDVRIDEVATLDWDVARTFWNVEPTWQNNIHCIQRAAGNHIIVQATVEKKFAGYAVVDKISGRIRQFAVKQEMRKKGLGRALLSCAANEKGEVSFTNYPVSDSESVSAFTALGLVPVVELYEMTFVHP